MKRILWASWSRDCAKFDLDRISNLKLNHQWVNYYETAHKNDDIILTGNGYTHTDCKQYKATLYAEPYIYLKGEYDRFHTDKRWNKRFVYNPELLKYPDTHIVPVAGYWRYDGFIPTIDKKHTFGMVLSCKPAPLDVTDIGKIRKEFVEALKGHDFVYYGSGWDKNDPNYKGEIYLSDHKFLDSQRLLSECKFSLALDNSVIQGYYTEKLWNGLGASTVPIYFGHKDIKTVVDPDAFIYGYDFGSFDEIIKYCESMDEETYRRKQNAAINAYKSDTKHAWEDIFQLMDSLL